MWSGCTAMRNSTSTATKVNRRVSEVFGTKTTKRDYSFSSQAFEYGWDQAQRINGMSFLHSQCYKSDSKRPDCRQDYATGTRANSPNRRNSALTRFNCEPCSVIRQNRCVRVMSPPIVRGKSGPGKKNSIWSAPSMSQVIRNLEGRPVRQKMTMDVSARRLSTTKAKSDDCRVRFSGMPDNSCCSQTVTATAASVAMECNANCCSDKHLVDGKPKVKYSSRPKRLSRSINDDNDNHMLKSSASVFSLDVEETSDLNNGLIALPKLLIDMRSQNKDTQRRSLELIKEHVAQSVNARNAITKLGVVRKAQELLMRLRRIDKVENAQEITQLLHIFETMSAYVIGAEAIAKRPLLLREFYRIINDSEKDKKCAAKILANLSEKPDVLKILRSKNSKAFLYLTRIFSKNPCKPHYSKDLWLHLGHFLEADPEEGIAVGFFELLYRRALAKMPLYHLQNMKCLSMLLCCKEGLCRFDAADGIFMLYQSFVNNSKGSKEYLVLTLMNALKSKRSLWRCNAFTDLPDILLRLAEQQDHPQQQLYCFKAMRLMTEMTCMRRYMSMQLIPRLREIVCGAGLNRCTRDELVLSLSRRIYDNGI